ncbi:MAG: flavin reductase [Candidatus Omnitrophica bacterium]|nr:flavin reductase [Candidatus Omnitrophota bacterium]
MNEESKRKILRQIPYGLYVVGVKGKDSQHAFTGSWLSQCSMKPPCVMLGVRQGTHSLDLIKEGRVFSINFLAKGDRKVMEQFFKPVPASGNRFGDVSYTLRRTGAPILDRAVGFLECEVRQIVEAGDHSVVIGEVVEAEAVKEEPPLVMSDTPWHYGG